MADTLLFFRTLANTQVVRDDCGYDCVSTDFYDGKVAYALNGTWAIKEATQALGSNLGITTLPSLNDIPMKALTAHVMLTFPNDSWHGPNRRAIRAFSQFLRTKASQIEIAEVTKMLPINPMWIEEIDNSRMHRAQLDLLHEVRFMPATLNYIAMWNPLRKGMLLHHNRHLTASEATKYMQNSALKSKQRMMELDSLK